MVMVGRLRLFRARVALAESTEGMYAVAKQHKLKPTGQIF